MISDAVEPLVYREYWQHLRVVQELLLARDITIHCGNISTSWRSLIAARDWLENHRPVVINDWSDNPFEQTHTTLLMTFASNLKEKSDPPWNSAYSALEAGNALTLVI